METTSPDAVVWVDDQLAFEADAQAWVTFLGRRLLALSPDPRRGISPAELGQMRSFLEQPLF